MSARPAPCAVFMHECCSVIAIHSFQRYRQPASWPHLAVKTPNMKSRFASLSGVSSGLRRCAGLPFRRSARSKLAPLVLRGPLPDACMPAHVGGVWQAR
eukprot:118578-Chlamydomonas_euryale.AAC.2